MTNKQKLSAALAETSDRELAEIISAAGCAFCPLRGGKCDSEKYQYCDCKGTLTTWLSEEARNGTV